jgi:site-specific recombinase XerD
MVPGREKGTPPPNKGKKYPAEPLTAEEARQLLQTCSRRAPTGIRNAALITMLYRAGLRVSEALALYPKDVNVENGTIRVLHGKGDVARTVGLDPEACAVVARWIDRRAALKINGRRRLFCTLVGKPVSSTYVRMMLRRLAGRAGIEKRIHPHGLRHTMAVEMLREGFDLVTIQRQLGHTSLATTERYLRHLSPEDVIQAVRSRSWTPAD